MTTTRTDRRSHLHRSKLLIGCLMAALTLSCARAPDPGTAPPASTVPVWRDLPADSLDLAVYLRSGGDERVRRTESGSRWSAMADESAGFSRRLHCLQEALAASPDRLDDWLRLSRMAARVGDHQRALDCLDRADELIRRLPPDRRRGLFLRTSLDRAWLYRDRAQLVKARNWQQRALELDSESRDAKLLQGLLRADMGDCRVANNLARDIEREIVARRDWNETYRYAWRWIRGMSDLAAGEPEKSLIWMSHARPDLVDAPRFFRDFGDLAARLGDDREAGRYYRLGFESLGLPADAGVTRIEGPPGHPAWLVGTRFTAGSTRTAAEAALDSFRVALPGEERTRWADAAAGLLSICIRKDLDAGVSRRQRGLLYAEIGADELAEDDLHRVVADAGPDGPVDPEILRRLGFLYVRTERPIDALPLLKRATDAEPSSASGWSWLGCALMAVGHENEGLAALERALSLSSDLPEAWYNRGLFHFRAHRWAEAAADLERAMQLAPGNLDILPMLQQAKVRAARDRAAADSDQ